MAQVAAVLGAEQGARTARDPVYTDQMPIVKSLKRPSRPQKADSPRATCETRTRDLSFTKAPLYQLS